MVIDVKTKRTATNVCVPVDIMEKTAKINQTTADTIHVKMEACVPLPNLILLAHVRMDIEEEYAKSKQVYRTDHIVVFMHPILFDFTKSRLY